MRRMRSTLLALVGFLVVQQALVFGANGQCLNRATTAFGEAIANHSAISLVKYAEGCRELQRMVGKFNKLFSFADGELGNMIADLERVGVLPGGERNPAYESIQSAIEYELEHNLVKSERPSATRRVADLQWAARFVSKFMEKLAKMGDNEDTSSAAKKAYGELFSKKHSWLIRTAVGFAFRTLPKKKNLVQKLVEDDSEIANNEVLRNAKIAEFANVTNELIKLLDAFYAEKNLTRI